MTAVQVPFARRRPDRTAGALRRSFVVLGLLVAAACRSTPTDESFAGEVDASCAGCQFGAASGDCDLAVRIGGSVLLVEGTGIDDHGDAHAPDGFCNAIRRARVRGRIEGNRFVCASFELLPAHARFEPNSNARAPVSGRSAE